MAAKSGATLKLTKTEPQCRGRASFCTIVSAKTAGRSHRGESDKQEYMAGTTTISGHSGSDL
jgi:hypothetical protein